MATKFRLKKGKGSVNSFSMDGVRYFPGDVVDLPATYKGEAWLEPLEHEKKVSAVPGKIEPAPAEAEEEKPDEAKKATKPSKPKK
jgi:hypothetical protein